MVSGLVIGFHEKAVCVHRPGTGVSGKNPSSTPDSSAMASRDSEYISEKR